jgi:hypothetical protein
MLLRTARTCPVLLYGSETWVLAKREENQLFVTICGSKLENGVYRKKYNFELKREFDSPWALKVVKTKKLHYAGHMIRKPEDLPQKTIFIAGSQGTRQQRRPKSRWPEWGEQRKPGPDWTNWAQDREQWKELLRQALTANWLLIIPSLWQD